MMKNLTNGDAQKSALLLRHIFEQRNETDFDLILKLETAVQKYSPRQNYTSIHYNHSSHNNYLRELANYISICLTLISFNENEFCRSPRVVYESPLYQCK